MQYLGQKAQCSTQPNFDLINHVVPCERFIFINCVQKDLPNQQNDNFCRKIQKLNNNLSQFL